jgi:hypothetical protein
MLAKNKHWILVGFSILFFVALGVLSTPDPASAATTADSSSNSCLSCHEDLYYLHDTGCWYCMTEPHKDRCTDCHEGNSESFKEEESHTALLPHPQENGGEKCKQCHTEDVQTRLDTFASEVGFEPVVKMDAYTPLRAVDNGFPETSKPEIIEKLPWAAGGIILFGFWLALVLMSPQKP